MQLDYESCVVESQIRLSRNLKAYPFPATMNEVLQEQLVSELREAFQTERFKELYTFIWRSGIDIGYAEQKMLQLCHGFNHKRTAYHIVEDPSANLMIFVGAYDHLEIQMKQYGFGLYTLYEKINTLDDLIDSAAEYAFDSELGYLTSQVTSLGTGLRASILMHLPALQETGQMVKMHQALNQIGVSLSGLSEDVSTGIGAFYRIQNHITLGQSENEILDTLSGIAREIARKEDSTLRELLISKRLETEDRVYRAYGILSQARMLSRIEALELLSSLRMGICAGIIKQAKLSELDKRIIDTDSGVLQLASSKILSAQELSVARAHVCRGLFAKEE